MFQTLKSRLLYIAGHYRTLLKQPTPLIRHHKHCAGNNTKLLAHDCQHDTQHPSSHAHATHHTCKHSSRQCCKVVPQNQQWTGTRGSKLYTAAHRRSRNKNMASCNAVHCVDRTDNPCRAKHCLRLMFYAYSSPVRRACAVW